VVAKVVYAKRATVDYGRASESGGGGTRRRRYLIEERGGFNGPLWVKAKGDSSGRRRSPGDVWAS